MIPANNNSELLLNLLEFVDRMEMLFDEFYENELQGGFILTITNEADIKRLKESGFPMWEETKHNLIRIKKVGYLIGLYRFLSIPPGFYPLGTD